MISKTVRLKSSEPAAGSEGVILEERTRHQRDRDDGPDDRKIEDQERGRSVSSYEPEARLPPVDNETCDEEHDCADISSNLSQYRILARTRLQMKRTYRPCRIERQKS